jgi:hypothetical protein
MTGSGRQRERGEEEMGGGRVGVGQRGERGELQGACVRF